MTIDTALQPPHDLDAEASVLGAALQSREAANIAAQTLSASDFYKPKNRTIFTAIEALLTRGEGVDGVTLATELQRRKKLDAVGGKPYIFELVDSVPAPSNAQHYARIVKAMSIRREIMRRANELGAAAMEGSPEAVAELVTKISGVSLNGHHASADTSSWAMVDIAAELERESLPQTPRVMARTDGFGLFYRGHVNGCHGEPECGKTWIAEAACAAEMFDGNFAMFVDFEDVARTAVERLRALGVPDDTIASRFLYVSPSEPLTPTGRTALDLALVKQPTIAVIDGMTDALHMHGLKTNAAEDIAEFYRVIARPIARAGAAVVTLDHVTKDRESRGRFAIGSEHKLAGIDGAAYALDVVKPFARGRSGRVRMRVSKDRRGEIRPAEVGGSIADIEIISDADTGEVGVFVRAPGAKDGPFRPTRLMERVSKLLESTDAVTTRVLRESVQGKATLVDLAASILVAEGFAERVPNGRATTFRTLRPYREDDDPESSDV